jgi:hypothetical protein
MSSLISAFFIQPVVRQARRFSNAQPPPRDVLPPQDAPQSQSHVSTSTPDIAEHHAPTQQQQQQQAITEEAQSGGNLGHATFDRYVPLVASSPSRAPAVPGAGSPFTRQASLLQHVYNPESVESVHTGLATSHNVTNQHTDITPVEVTIIAEEDMAPFDVAERLGEGGLSPSTASLSRNSTLRRTSARDIPRMGLSTRTGSPGVTSSLPEDDGMRLLRARIHEIRELAESQDEKARRMHELMTAEWKAAQVSIRPQTPASMTSQDRPFLPSSPLSFSARASSPLSTSSIPFDAQNPYNIEPEDLQPSYRPITLSESPTDPNNNEDDLSPPVPELGCKHYKRNVKIQCYDCKNWYPCRHCHDNDQPGHHLNRRATENMLCMLCFTPQAAGQWCKECGERGAWYYCDICKLWDDDGSKSIYHCSDCGICRRGEGIGKDFIHCKVSIHSAFSKILSEN